MADRPTQPHMERPLNPAAPPRPWPIEQRAAAVAPRRWGQLQLSAARRAALMVRGMRVR